MLTLKCNQCLLFKLKEKRNEYYSQNVSVGIGFYWNYRHSDVNKAGRVLLVNRQRRFRIL